MREWGQGWGTGFAGMSAAAVISPMLITFLGMDSYMAVGIALSSDVLAVPGIDRMFLHNPGANHTFCTEDIPQKELEEAALFHFGCLPLMRLMYEDGGAELLNMMKRVKACGAATSLDFAAIEPICAGLRKAMSLTGCCPAPVRETPASRRF